MSEFDPKATQEHHPDQALSDNSRLEELPQRIGRYRVEKILGQGGFGLVYLAQDETLDRPVAVKVPHSRLVSRPEDAEIYLAEARTVASLEHPHIVPVHDVGSSAEFPFFVVSRYVPGRDLATHLKQTRLSYTETADLVATIAEALHYAHKRGIVHRDVKPGNILIDKGGKPFIVDFGLALREESIGKGARHVGTPAYMSPEQSRGEGHRVDGRSDIFSLGVLFYEILAGRRPFRAATQAEVLDQIQTLEPRPLSQYDERIPKELQRICLKALSKRASDRFSSAHEMAEDLRHFLNSPESLSAASNPKQNVGSTETAVPATPTQRDSVKSTKPGVDSDRPISDSQVIKIVPKGLRSFDAHDAEFFLELLPGARDRNGLPDSLRFWKTRIEETDPDNAFSVGLIYGPSGCGKSSLVKAGLLPRLSPDVIAIYLEATPDETELRLLSGLRKRCPLLEEQWPLAESLAALRRGQTLPPGKKVLIVIDQFEQWLHAKRDQEHTDLVAAIRQCDGNHVQCIVMVRDDFWMAATRFMKELDIRLVEGQNSAAVDLFPIRHAEKVLAAFGRAIGTLPSETKSLSEDQSAFLSQAVAGLAEEGKVVSVRLALFAEMFKGRSWTPAALIEVGGTTGVGVTFLEETFSAKTAPPEHRYHQAATRAVLSHLLPGSGTDIKGHMRSREELLAASGYATRHRDFEDLLRILDSETRLITPTDLTGFSEGTESVRDTTQRFYQLSHDYLVPSLRDWLTRKQRETRKGRAELKLAERAAVWGANPENKHLPTFWEWLTIGRLTENAKWRTAEQRMMAQATRYHTIRSVLATVSGLLLMLSGLGLKRWNDAVQLEREATNLVSSIAGADYSKLPDWIELSNSMRTVVDPKLKVALEQHDLQSDERLKLSLALLPSDPQQLDFLVSRLLTAEANQVPLLISRLQPYATQIEPQLWMAARRFDRQSLLQTASALAAYAPDSENWVSISQQVADQVVQENPLRIAVWIETLRPAAKWFNPELLRIYVASSPARSQTEIDLATDILQSYATDDFQLLHELVLVGQPPQFRKMFGNYQRFSQQAMDALREELARPFTPENPDASEAELQRLRLQYIARQANAAVALMRLEDPKPVYEFLTVNRIPDALSQFIFRIRGREVSPMRLISSFQELQGQEVPEDPLLRKQHIYRLYGLILGLGEYTLEQLPAQQRDGLVTQLAEMYGNHPSRAVHSALGWLLRRWGQDELVRQVDETPLAYDESGVREWYVLKIDPTREDRDESVDTDVAVDEEVSAAVPKPLIDLSAPIYFTMIVFPGGEFDMGEVGQTRKVKVAGPIAVSDREVTWRQFSPIDGDTHRQDYNRQPSFRNLIGERQLQPDEPVFGVKWFEAVNYCRWLTEAAGMDESAQSYQQIEFPRGAQSRPGWLELPVATEWPMRLDRPGFRLLREEEWEYVARAGMETEYSFGDDRSLLGEYCWHKANSGGWLHRTGQLRPSVGGLFDIHGNLWEWTDDWWTRGRTA